jgi:hypothetical protein
VFGIVADSTSIHVGTAAPGCPAGRSPAVCGKLPLRVSNCFASILVLLIVTLSLSASDCIPIGEAGKHVGETKCVTGKVTRVKTGARGVQFLDFCEDQMACPFTVVVFSHDLKDVGDIRRLAGRTIEVKGAVKLYDGRAEIILSRVSQISGAAAMLPPIPKNYDVEQRGHYSAGHMRPAKKPAKVKPTPNPTSTYGNESDAGEPPE